jgi:glutathione S-transferase
MRAREFLSEEEYDDGAGQLGQNPAMQKVNADRKANMEAMMARMKAKS